MAELPQLLGVHVQLDILEYDILEYESIFT